MRWLLENRWISVLVRTALGIIFVYSAVPKIADPPGFAQMIWNYRLLPDWSVAGFALVLPWMELFAAAALIGGVLRKGASLIIGALLVAFIFGIGINLARGNPIDCGCFGTVPTARSAEELFAGMRLDIARDIGLLIMAVQVFFSPIRWRPSRTL